MLRIVLLLLNTKDIHHKYTMTKKKSTEKKIKERKPKKVDKENIIISSEEYDLLRQQIISLIWKHTEIDFIQLFSSLEKNLADKISTPLLLCANQIITDLEDQGVIEQVPGKRIQYLRLKQRMEKDKD